MLQKMEGLGNKEIADIMNTSLTAVESLQLRAKKKLKEILQKTYDNIDHS
jgi:DNA-directed RNA polymerase specialized sigma24 family protein